MEYPIDLTNSFSNFKYSHYVRGGGAENEGVSINNFYFISGNIRYVVFDNWYSKDDSYKYGIRTINLKTNKEIIINSVNKSIKGSLDILKENERIQNSNEFFE